MTRPRLGLIVNPIAGMGGRVGLKGTDGADTLARARALGAVPIAEQRAAGALARLPAATDILTPAGAMGEDVARACGLAPTVVGDARPGETTAADTRAAAALMAGAPVDLLLFAGGDGTARDIHDAAGGRLPVLGIPTGVKMHSAVFATSPAAAGRLAALYLGPEQARVRLRDAEVMDIDEPAMRAGRLSARLYGYLRVPYRRPLVQAAKAAAPGGEAAAEAACRRIAAGMARDRLYIVGPGTTTAGLMAALGLAGSLLGVDAVRNRCLLGTDLGEAQLLALLDDADAAEIVVAPIGGQGYVFGRGNQPISAKVIRRVGRGNITVVASMEKILSFGGGPLRVDTGDECLDRALGGFIRVLTGPGRSTVLRIES